MTERDVKAARAAGGEPGETGGAAPDGFDVLAPDYNRLLQEQLRFFDGDGGYFASYKVEVVRSLLASPPRRVLDYGCGVGRNLLLFREAFPGAEVVGCDPSEKSLEEAARACPEAALFRIGEDAPHARGRFDLVFVANVLHHVPPGQRGAVAWELASLTGPAGDLVIFEHNPINPVTRHLVRTSPIDEGVVLLPRSETLGLVRRCGLEVKRSRFTLFFPERLRSLRFLESRLGWFPLGGQYYVQAGRER